MDRYIPYIKIAVCTQNPGVNDTIREYAAGFEVRAGVKIQVDIMKNCYPLAKKILDREHYDVICLGRKLWDIDSYTFASSIRMTDQETIFLLLGWDRLTLPQIEKVAPVAYLHTPLQKEEFRKELYRVLSRLGPGRRYLSIHTPGYKSRMLYRDITYICRSGNTVLLHTLKGVYRAQATMEEIEEELIGIQERFLKVHRNYLVNHRYISWMYQQKAGLMDGTRIPVSQIYRKRIEQAFAENRKEMMIL